MGGLFITFEGIDGSGKSTQLDLLERELKRRGLDVIVTREPGGTEIGKAVRALMLSDVSVRITPVAELLLYVADRAQHVSELIRPALEQGRIIISDRYTDSTVAFQGHGRGLDLKIVDELNRIATGGLAPDLTIIFDVDPLVARTRQRSSPVGGLLGAFDEQDIEFHSRMREGYFKMAEAQPDRIKLVDASGPAFETHQSVLTLLRPVLERQPV